MLSSVYDDVYQVICCDLSEILWRQHSLVITKLINAMEITNEIMLCLRLFLLLKVAYSRIRSCLFFIDVG